MKVPAIAHEIIVDEGDWNEGYTSIDKEQFKKMGPKGQKAALEALHFVTLIQYQNRTKAKLRRG